MRRSSTSRTGIVELRSGVRDTLGRPLRDLRISVMDRCNFRCPYCMPEDIYDRNFRFPLQRGTPFVSRNRAANPPLRPEWAPASCVLPAESHSCARTWPTWSATFPRLDGVDDIALTTNGVLLAATGGGAHRRRPGSRHGQPGRRGRGVVPAYERGQGTSRCRTGWNLGSARGTRIEPGKDQRRSPSAASTTGMFPSSSSTSGGSGMILRFIEYMDVGTINNWSATQTVPAAEIVEMIHGRWPLVAAGSQLPR